MYFNYTPVRQFESCCSSAPSRLAITNYHYFDSLTRSFFLALVQPNISLIYRHNLWMNLWMDPKNCRSAIWDFKKSLIILSNIFYCLFVNGTFKFWDCEIGVEIKLISSTLKFMKTSVSFFIIFFGRRCKSKTQFLAGEWKRSRSES